MKAFHAHVLLSFFPSFLSSLTGSPKQASLALIHLGQFKSVSIYMHFQDENRKCFYNI